MCAGLRKTISGRLVSKLGIRIRLSYLISPMHSYQCDREELTNGCRILHYSGHGERDCLCFEDMFGG